MYSIVHILTGVTLTEIGEETMATEDFYSYKDCMKFIKNFMKYDEFQRRLHGRANYKWLIHNNRFTYAQYMLLFNSLQIKTPFVPNPHSLVKEEFTIIKTGRNSRTWKTMQLLQRLAEL